MSFYSKMFKAACALCVAGLPGMAYAGTATGTGTATLNVVDQCSVTGATVNLGTYTTSQRIEDVAAELGDMWTAYTPGSRGQSYLTWGTINCSNGLPYSLSIKGTSVEAPSPGGIQFAWTDAQNLDYRANFDIYVKSIGGVAVADSNGLAVGAGAKVNTDPASGTGTGTDQEIVGSVAFNYPASMSLYSTKLPSGTHVDTLSYTLTF